ncbi:MAG: hypothetical protein HOV81_39125 [Kofleriaceae bacterium]|nr:hypothetical protein [Kofleriaceae bacterium]
MRLAVVCLALAAAGPAAAQTWSPADSWSPVDDDGWPRGVSLDDLRGLHECGPGELDVREGGPIGCRPSVIHDGPQLQFGIDWTSGPVFGSDRVSGGAHALGVEASYALTRSLSLAGRYELMGIAPSMLAMAEGALNQHFLGLLKYRLFGDEVGRKAWTLGAGAGWALRPSSLGSDAPLARVSLAREVGAFVDDNNAIGTALEVAYERTLDDDALSALLVSYRFGFELNIREPRNVDQPAPSSSTWRSFTADAYLGNALGFGSTLGLRANRVLSLETSAGFQFGRSDFSKQHGYSGSSWSVMTGPRLSLPFDPAAPYVQVQAGPAWFSRPEGSEIRGLAHAELGMRLHVGCGTVIDAGFWLRGDIEDRDVTSGGLLMRVGAGPSRGWRCGPAAPMFATRPAPPSTWTAETTPTEPPMYSTATLPPRPPTVSTETTVTVTPPVVEVRPIVVQPIVIEVELGIAIPGLQMRFDPRLVPIGRLRGAGHIAIEISGPSDALATFQSQLAATLDRSGVRVEGWSLVATGSTRIRARITITP